MSTLSAIVAGISTTGKELLSKAMENAFGSISIDECTKDNLRYKVKLAQSVASIVLVVLDSSSENLCKDLVGPLITSNKYYKYSDDTGLVQFLNDVYGLSLELSIPEEVQLSSVQSAESPASGTVSEDFVERLKEQYDAQLEDKNSRISNLLATIQELTAIVESGGYAVSENNNEAESALRAAQEECLTLRSSLATAIKERDDFSAKYNAELDKVTSLITSLGDAEKKLATVQSAYDDALKSLTESRDDASRKSGVIRDKETKISSLEKQIATLSEEHTSFVSVKLERDTATSEVTRLNGVIAGLNHTLSSKDTVIVHLQEQLQESGKDTEELGRLRKELADAQADVSSLKSQLVEAQGKVEAILKDASDHKELEDSYKAKSEELEGKLQKQDDYIGELNIKVVQLTSELEVYRTSMEQDSSMDSLLNEKIQLQRRLALYENNPFTKIGMSSMPRTAVNAKLFETSGVKYQNIRFVFSGSTESRKGTYRCLRNEFAGSKENHLIVDLVSESSVDYVFEVQSVVKGLKWFEDGGGVQPYLSTTCQTNTKILSPGMWYVNDSWFLTINWENRLKELENSGYKVVIYCGDLSNIVGRVLFETFADVGTTEIYVHGNSVGSRTMVVMSGGVTNISRACVKYFELDKNVMRFYTMVERLCPCEIVSYSR